MPAPKPEKGDHVIRIYCTHVFKEYFKKECRKRGVSESALGRIALYEYFQPKQVVMIEKKSDAIVRIDRTPKGSKEVKQKAHFRQVMAELKKIDLRELLKPVGSFDSEIKFIEKGGENGTQVEPIS